MPSKQNKSPQNKIVIVFVFSLLFIFLSFYVLGRNEISLEKRNLIISSGTVLNTRPKFASERGFIYYTSNTKVTIFKQTELKNLAKRFGTKEKSILNENNQKGSEELLTDTQNRIKIPLQPEITQ